MLHACTVIAYYATGKTTVLDPTRTVVGRTALVSVKERTGWIPEGTTGMQTMMMSRVIWNEQQGRNANGESKEAGWIPVCEMNEAT